MTAGSSDAIFRLVGQTLEADSGGDCSENTVNWSFVDTSTGRRVDVAEGSARLGTITLPGGYARCTTSTDPSMAPQVTLPPAFNDGRPHTVKVDAELSASGSRSVTDSPPDCTPHDPCHYPVWEVADEDVTVRVAPPAGSRPPVPSAPPPVQQPPPSLQVAPISFAPAVTYPPPSLP